MCELSEESFARNCGGNIFSRQSNFVLCPLLVLVMLPSDLYDVCEELVQCLGNVWGETWWR